MQHKKSTHAGSTQKFTEIEDIIEDIVVFKGGSAALVIQVQANNFTLLSKEEQDGKIYAYASMLNSLSYPIQVLIQNKKIDISSYINRLSKLAENTTGIHPTLSESQNQALSSYIHLYRDFVTELVKVNTVLDKQFYLIIPYSFLEKGVSSIKNVAGKQKDDFFHYAQSTLHTKADALLGQIARLSLQAKILQKEQLIKLFYGLYNTENTTPEHLGTGTTSGVIKGAIQK